MNLLHTLKSGLTSAFISLPLLLIAFVGLLAIGLGNVGLFVLLLGHTIIIPIAVFFGQLITSRIGGIYNPMFYVRSSDIGQLVPSATPTASFQNVTPSYWLTHIWFFMTYLLTNAIKVYGIPKDAKAMPHLYENRRARSIALMATSSLFVVLFTVLRYMMGTETPVGVLVSAVVGGLLGWGWYEFAEVCGARHADIFGIAQQILPEAARKSAPMTCVYSAKP